MTAQAHHQLSESMWKPAAINPSESLQTSRPGRVVSALIHPHKQIKLFPAAAPASAATATAASNKVMITLRL